MPDNLYEPRVTPGIEPGGDVPMSVTPEAMGAGIGEAIQGLGEAESEVWRRAKARANQAAAFEADVQTSQFLNARVYDPKTGILNQPLGKDSTAAADKLLSDYRQHVANVATTMTPEQRDMFHRMSTSKGFELERTLGRYEHEQLVRYEDDQHHAKMANLVTDAVNNADDPEIIESKQAGLQALLADQAKAKHWSPDELQSQVRSVTSATNLAVINQLVSSGKDGAAKKWYDSHQDQFTAQDKPNATKLVEAGTTAGDAQRITDGLLHTQDGAFRSRLDIDQDIAKISDPKIRDAVQTRANQAIGQHLQAVEEQQAQQVTDLYNLGKKDGAYSPAVVAGLATLPLDKQQQLQRALTTQPPKASPKYAQVKNMVGTDSFLDYDMSQLIGVVPDEERKELIDLQAEQRAKGLTSAKVAEATNQNQIVNTGLDELFGKGASNTYTNDTTKYRLTFDTAKRAALVANAGKPLSNDDLNSIRQQLASDYVVRVERSRWNPYAMLLSAQTEESQGALYTQKPEVVAQQIGDTLRAQPLPGTRGKTGDYLSHGTVDSWWVPRLSDRKSPDFQPQFDKLMRWKQGLADDGTFDPALQERYRVIYAAWNAAPSLRERP